MNSLTKLRAVSPECATARCEVCGHDDYTACGCPDVFAERPNREAELEARDEAERRARRWKR